jgi:serine/threonine-protein kinase RsbT
MTEPENVEDPRSERLVSIGSELDVVSARVEGRNLAKEMGFGVIDQARIATVVSELARNILLYAGEGQVTLGRLELDDRTGLQVICQDQGPGIEDLDAVMESADSEVLEDEEGMGLPGAKRLMDEFEIQSEPGMGTRVTVCKWLTEG